MLAVLAAAVLVPTAMVPLVMAPMVIVAGAITAVAAGSAGGATAAAVSASAPAVEPAAADSTAAPDPGGSDPTLSPGALDVRAVVPDRAAVLTAALDAYAATVPAQFAVAVLDHRTGTSFTYGGDVAIRTASVVKVDILAAVVLRAQDAGRDLTASEQSLAAAMIRNSDNDAASTLWWSIGGSAGLAASDARLGLTETVPGSGEYWGATTTTVADRIHLLDTIADPAGPLAAHRDYILGLMGTVEVDQAWGVSAAATGGDEVALKNGWIGLDNGWTVNSIGRITGATSDITIAILSQYQPSYADGIASVERIATLAQSELAW
jgi:hypothetical protein